MRGGDGPQYYGNSRNQFWNIAGSALGFDRGATPYKMQVAAFTKAGYALWDVIGECRRRCGGSTDGDIHPGSEKGNDIRGLLLQHPTIERIVFARASAALFRKAKIFPWLRDGPSSGFPIEFFFRAREKGGDAERTAIDTAKMFGTVANIVARNAPIKNLRYRAVELIVLPSTSPASAKMRAPEKERLWHIGCYGLDPSPEDNYICPACGLKGAHWLQECEARDDFISRVRDEKAKVKKETKSKGVALPRVPRHWWYHG